MSRKIIPHLHPHLPREPPTDGDGLGSVWVPGGWVWSLVGRSWSPPPSHFGSRFFVDIPGALRPQSETQVARRACTRGSVTDHARVGSPAGRLLKPRPLKSTRSSIWLGGGGRCWHLPGVWTCPRATVLVASLVGLAGGAACVHFAESWARAWPAQSVQSSGAPALCMWTGLVGVLGFRSPAGGLAWSVPAGASTLARGKPEDTVVSAHPPRAGAMEGDRTPTPEVWTRTQPTLFPIWLRTCPPMFVTPWWGRRAAVGARSLAIASGKLGCGPGG